MEIMTLFLFCSCSWLNYRPIGERIAGTRFIAFKVPLRKVSVRLTPQTG